MRILLVEDEIDLAKSLKRILEYSKYVVDVVNDGEDALLFAQTYKYDLIILDVMIPKKNGIEVLEEIRMTDGDVKIIMLTAKTLTDDKVRALNLGADDYITKPFESSELLARIRSALRVRKVNMINVYSYEDISLDLDSYELKNDVASFVLGKKEYLIMKMLLENTDKIVLRETFYDKVWDADSEFNDNVLWVYVSYLRKKLKKMNSSVIIKLIRGVGYQIEVSYGK